MLPISEQFRSLYYEEIDFKEYKFTFLFDKNYNFFALLVNWEERQDIVEIILNKYCPEDVELYKTDYGNREWVSFPIEWELNIKLLDLIFNNL